MFFSQDTDTKLIPGVTDMLKAAPFLHFFDGISIRILSLRLKKTAEMRSFLILYKENLYKENVRWGIKN